jgi:deoxyguanosine kinase
MKTQNQVVLSLGSNLGHKQETIAAAIDLIHNSIGTIIKISSLYESPSWGFESDNFYNCVVLIHTSKTPQKILSKLLKIEKELGRKRQETQEYQARAIDIDIIYFNNEIIEAENLIVPHPKMHARLFVLLPLNDLKLDWKHPIINQKTSELIKTCEDKSSLQLVASFDLPLAKLKLDTFNYWRWKNNFGD